MNNFADYICRTQWLWVAVEKGSTLQQELIDQEEELVLKRTKG